MAEPVHVIVNPNAAGGKGRRAIPRLRQILDARGIPFTIEATERPGHARALARRASGNGARNLVVVGGDGTLHEVANGLLEREEGGAPHLAVYPVGTGNDFHRMVRAPRDLEGVVSLLATGRPRAFEVGVVRWEGGMSHFVNLLGVGIDVEVLRRRSRFRHLPGLLQYGGALIAAAARYHPVHLTVEIQTPAGATLRREVETLLTTVTVGPSVGGGFMLSPAARPDDGALDLFVVDDLGLLGILRHLPSVFRGTHGSIPQIQMERIRRARLESPGGRPLHFELDGELMTDPSPWLDIEVRPGGLSVLEAPGAADGMKR